MEERSEARALLPVTYMVFGCHMQTKQGKQEWAGEEITGEESNSEIKASVREIWLLTLPLQAVQCWTSYLNLANL